MGSRTSLTRASQSGAGRVRKARLGQEARRPGRRSERCGEPQCQSRTRLIWDSSAVQDSRRAALGARLRMCAALSAGFVVIAGRPSQTQRVRLPRARTVGRFVTCGRSRSRTRRSRFTRTLPRFHGSALMARKSWRQMTHRRCRPSARSATRAEIRWTPDRCCRLDCFWYVVVLHLLRPYERCSRPCDG